ncbi:ABC transporter permease [Planotetraspora sp. A-T 1434]|uniref:ABC transporter permease n=1 Tax=Planotetraspora sp. A-T 1434 TaxID=2979219 RepID=UPI0021BEADE6|nr:ABC transporter permease [Planotetraspora sp. A-T 1434]MCT9931391.1 ABC transporter permease [Planotetraspora sp. A-T 1434]
MSAIRAAVRISRRDVWRAKGRSALIMVMIGLPVLLITVAATLVATRDLDPSERLPFELGAADAAVTDLGLAAPIRQSATEPESFRTDRDAVRPPLTRAEVEAVFGAGTRAIPTVEDYEEYRSADGYEDVSIDEIDCRDPMATGMFHLRQGRFPQAADEVAVSVPVGVGVGAVLRVTRDDTPKRVVGVVAAPPPLMGYGRQIIALPGTLLKGAGAGNRRTTWLVDAPGPVTWEQLRHANRSGLSVLSRAVVQDPPPAGDSPDDAIVGQVARQAYIAETAALTATILTLEVVLLAGPAFAVGLRRRRRELALIAAQGASGNHLKLIVVSDGLVLGAGAAVLGATLGVGVARIVVAVLGQWPEGEMGPFDVPAGQIITVVALGILSGVIAAVVPAIQAARADVVAALAGRRGQVRDRAGWPLLGALLVAAGLAVTAYGAWHGQNAILGGAVLGELGLVALTPRLISVIGLMAGRFPLPLRLAARDASRNRGRTAPAVAAVLAAAAGFSMVAVVTATDHARDRQTYKAAFRMGTTAVYGDDVTAESWRRIRPIVDKTLPGVPLVEVRAAVDGKGRHLDLTLLDGNCEGCVTFGGSFGALPVGGPDLLRYLIGRTDTGAERALAEGRAVIFNPAAVRQGKVRLQLTTRTTSDEGEPPSVSLPAVVVTVSGPTAAAGVAPSSAFTSLGYSLKLTHLIVDPAVKRLTPADEQRLSGPVRAVTPKVAVTLERGYREDGSWTLLVFLIAASVIVLGATFTATGLAAADYRPDLETLSAIGAQPRTRRLVVAGQAAVITGVGVPLGLAAGLVPGAALAVETTIRFRSFIPDTALNGFRYPSLTVELGIPWPLLGAVALGLPLLAALVCGAVTRSRLPAPRRLV